MLFVADIGGTNCRFALAAEDAAPGTFSRRMQRQVADSPGVEDALAAALAAWPEARGARAALAVAGPVSGGRARLTNAAWAFDADALAQRFGFAEVRLLNDLEAQGHALVAAGPDAFEAIGPALEPPRPALSVVSPGTGLGVALVSTSPPARVLTAEGGHVGCAPGDEIAPRLLAAWGAELGRVTWEHVLSGPGLARLHHGLAGVARDPAAILERGLAGDALEAATLACYVRLLGVACGDFARAHGAGAVALTGRIARTLGPTLRAGGFRAAFEAGGPNAAYMAAIPTLLSRLDEPGLTGAQAALRGGV